MLEMGREAICTKRHFFVFYLSFKKIMLRLYDNYPKPTSSLLEADLEVDLEVDVMKPTRRSCLVTDSRILEGN